MRKVVTYTRILMKNSKTSLADLTIYQFQSISEMT